MTGPSLVQFLHLFRVASACTLILACLSSTRLRDLDFVGNYCPFRALDIFGLSHQPVSEGTRSTLQGLSRYHNPFHVGD